MAINLTLDPAKTGRPYPHYWEFCVGSCHAATLLRADVQAHIRKAHAECGFRYIRFHGLLDDDMSVYFKSMMGPTTISFYNIDLIFDFLLSIGMKPFIELGFMPEALASGTQTCFHYKGNVTMPADDEKWQDLIRQLTQHLIDRYGKGEVAQWFFEVWNEPNLNFFFDGTQEDYFHLYEMTARAIKSVDADLKVGGPATSVNAWIVPFKAFCEENHVPLDFISTHHYPSDDPLSVAGMNGPGTKGKLFDEEAMKQFMAMSEEERAEIMKKMFSHRENKNPRDILRTMTAKASGEAAPYPLYYTEWNGSVEFDTPYQAAIVAQTLAYNEGYVKGYSFWTVSDIFEEMGMLPGPFKNAFGMLTNHGVPKPVYHVFKTLHEAGDIRLDVENGMTGGNVEAMALTDGNETTVLVYNHDLDRRTVKAEEVSFTIRGGARQVLKAVIDETHANPEAAWKEMGSPKYLTADQVARLNEVATLQWELVDGVSGKGAGAGEGVGVGAGAEGETVVRFVAEPESVTVLKFRN